MYKKKQVAVYFFLRLMICRIVIWQFRKVFFLTDLVTYYYELNQLELQGYSKG